MRTNSTRNRSGARRAARRWLWGLSLVAIGASLGWSEEPAPAPTNDDEVESVEDDSQESIYDDQVVLVSKKTAPVAGRQPLDAGVSSAGRLGADDDDGSPAASASAGGGAASSGETQSLGVSAGLPSTNLIGQQKNLSLTGSAGTLAGTTSQEIRTLAADNAGSVLRESASTTGVTVQRRSAIAFDPHVRGFRLGQLLTDGGGITWIPVRPDLDSMISKFDPTLINDIVVHRGPYTTRMGPGFTFLDASLASTPRYADGYESHNRFGYDIRSNGGQQYLHDTYYAGDEDYGVIVNYGRRVGGDYRAGNGQIMPASYLADTYTAQVGLNLTETTKLETRVDYLDQTKTQIPGQFFNVDVMQTTAYSVGYHNYDAPDTLFRARIDAWYTETPLKGSTAPAGSDIFNVTGRVNQALEQATGLPANFSGTTAARSNTSGGRLETLVGDEELQTLRLGTDFRYQQQRIGESFQTIPGFPTLNTFMPRSEMLDPGVYTEWAAHLSSKIATRAGARVDFVRTGIYDTLDSSLNNYSLAEARKADTTYAFYLTNDMKLNDHWGANISFGQAQRPPTLVERYADGVFVSVLQTGFTKVVGNPNITPERLWQVDASMSANYDNVRGRAGAFYSWVHNYITYEVAGVAPGPVPAQVINYTNTPLAVLTGYETDMEIDLSRSTTFYGAQFLAIGTDATLGTPLAAMSPIDSRLGIRWHDPENPGLWGWDLGTRIVGAQTRLGDIRTFDGNHTIVETRTPFFWTVSLRGYWNPKPNMTLVGGVENMFDRAYYEHLDLRLGTQPSPFYPPPSNPVFAYAPGITPYMGFNWTF